MLVLYRNTLKRVAAQKHQKHGEYCELKAIAEAVLTDVELGYRYMIHHERKHCVANHVYCMRIFPVWIIRDHRRIIWIKSGKANSFQYCYCVLARMRYFMSDWLQLSIAYLCADRPYNTLTCRHYHTTHSVQLISFNVPSCLKCGFIWTWALIIFSHLPLIYVDPWCLLAYCGFRGIARKTFVQYNTR